jgi:hypothetical protein
MLLNINKKSNKQNGNILFNNIIGPVHIKQIKLLLLLGNLQIAAKNNKKII